MGGVAVAFAGHGVEGGDDEHVIGVFVGVGGLDAGAGGTGGAFHGFGGAGDGDGLTIKVKVVAVGVEEDGVVLAAEAVLAGAAGLVVPDSSFWKWSAPKMSSHKTLA